jgi:hypothetical protein
VFHAGEEFFSVDWFGDVFAGAAGEAFCPVFGLLRAASKPIGRLADYADHLMNHTASNTGDDACLVTVQVR